MTKVKVFLVAVMITLAGILALATPVSAADISEEQYNKVCSGIDDEALRSAAGCDAKEKNATDNAFNLINVAIGVAGIVAVIMIVIGGQRYIVSAGDPGKMKQAKDMIIYSIIGLIVALLAFAIINFVSGAITSDSNTGKNAFYTENHLG